MDNTNTHTDSRGTITDLLVTDDFSITHITFKEGAVRGNHYHKETVQKDCVLKGSLVCAQDNKVTNVYEGDWIQTEANVSHAYKAFEDSEIISICWGKRRGSDYEKDVIRLTDNDKLL